MILFLLTLSLFFGLKIKFDIALYIIISILYLLFIAYRFRKLLIPCICFIFLGVIISFISFDWNTTVFSGVVTESKENYYLLNSKFEKLYVYEKNNDKEVGDLIRIKGYKKELSFQETIMT